MLIGKIEMQILYDIQCDFCGSHRSTEHVQLIPITQKPTARILKAEGWTSENGRNKCPLCNKTK